MSEPIVTQTHKVFSESCCARVHIRATPEQVWQLLADTREVPRWTSTISQIEGELRQGQRLVLHAPGTAEPITFTVAELEPGARMVWTRGLRTLVTDVRTFELHSRAHGTTDFAMEERLTGLAVPVVRGSLPDVDEVIERFAADLKHEAERDHRC